MHCTPIYGLHLSLHVWYRDKNISPSHQPKVDFISPSFPRRKLKFTVECIILICLCKDHEETFIDLGAKCHIVLQNIEWQPNSKLDDIGEERLCIYQAGVESGRR